MTDALRPCRIVLGELTTALPNAEATRESDATR
jgi:hypothetical protein